MLEFRAREALNAVEISGNTQAGCLKGGIPGLLKTTAGGRYPNRAIAVCMGSSFLALLLIGSGLFSICGGTQDWEWFMTSQKAAFFVTLFGRQGARKVYMALGLVLVLLGLGALLGLIPPTHPAHH